MWIINTDQLVNHHRDRVDDDEEPTELPEGGLGPDAEPAHVAARRQLQQVQGVHLGKQSQTDELARNSG